MAAKVGITRRTAEAVRGLLGGMGITIRHFVRFDEVITQQYPENRATLRMAPRFRGRVVLQRDPAAGTYRCTACGLCAKICPNNSLTVERERDPETQKFRLARFLYRFERCTLCGLCVEACKFSAIAMGQEFENAACDRRALVQVLNTPDGRPATAPPEALVPKPAPAAAPKPAAVSAAPAPPAQPAPPEGA